MCGFLSQSLDQAFWGFVFLLLEEGTDTLFFFPAGLAAYCFWASASCGRCRVVEAAAKSFAVIIACFL
jgi:hypothetical protein